MEGVGARLGRSSTRYGPTTVFTGPVRKWKKKWVHVSHSSNSANHTTSQSNGNNGSHHLLLYKWSPISQANENNNNGEKSKEDNVAAASDELPRKKFKYIPIAVLEEQKREEMEEVDEEAKPGETDPSEEATPKTDVTDAKPDINDVPMEEAQAADKDQTVPQDLNESSLDLSLGLKGPDGEPKPETEQGGSAE